MIQVTSFTPADLVLVIWKAITYNWVTIVCTLQYITFILTFFIGLKKSLEIIRNSRKSDNIEAFTVMLLPVIGACFMLVCIYFWFKEKFL